VKFTESGSITVTCRVNDKGQSESNHVSNPSEAGVCPIEIIVSDTGCGIPSEKLAAIFVLLEQAEFSSPDKGASGLGKRFRLLPAYIG
jgi:signal transduction histidine kinase